MTIPTTISIPSPIHKNLAFLASNFRSIRSFFRLNHDSEFAHKLPGLLRLLIGDITCRFPHR